MTFDSQEPKQDPIAGFSKNRIAIRERSILEILDLALIVVRGNFAALAVAFLVGVLPVMALNMLILSSYATPDFQEDYAWYVALMVPLVVWTMPLATAPITLVLGQVLFTDQFSARELWRRLRESLPQLLWYQVLWRGLLTPLFVTWFFFYSYQPYFNEVILLERNPMWRSPRGQTTSRRRSAFLHRDYSGELFSRWMCSAAIGLLLLAAVWNSIAMVRAIFLGAGEWYAPWMVSQWGNPMFTLYYPLSLWLVVGFFCVVRFLGYVDLRIRREGWDVELLMRAEKARMSRRLT